MSNAGSAGSAGSALSAARASHKRRCLRAVVTVRGQWGPQQLTVAGEGARGLGRGEGEGDRDDTPSEILQEAAKRMSLAAPPAERAERHKDTLGPANTRAAGNRVLQDGILKEKVHLQELTRKSWQRKWGFLAHQEEVFRQEAEAARVDHRRLGLRAEPADNKAVEILPSPPIPRLSSGLVGWRSSQPGLTLERVGALYKSPLRTIDPPEEPGDVPRGRQSFIFLG